MVSFDGVSDTFDSIEISNWLHIRASRIEAASISHFLSAFFLWLSVLGSFCMRFQHLYLMVSASQLTLYMRSSYGRSNFQNDPIFILRPFLKSSWKTDNWKYFPFSQIRLGTQPKLWSKIWKKGKFTFHIKECYLYNIRGGFWMGSWGNIKKRRTLSIVSILQGFRIWHQNWNSNNLKFWLPIKKKNSRVSRVPLTIVL